MLASLGLALAAVLTCAATAGAASFTVNDTSDAALETTGSAECVSTDGGKCTLRAAVQAADNAGGASTITLPAGEYKLTIPSTGADDPSTGDLDVKGTGTKLTITGAGSASTIINANHIDRAFAVQLGESLTISGVTVENGSQRSGASEDSTLPYYGGAFLNYGSLSIEHSVLSHDFAKKDGGAVFTEHSASSTSIADSTIEYDSSERSGGAIYAYGGTTTLSGDRIANNHTYDDGGAIGVSEYGGPTGELMITYCQIDDNTSGYTGGALYLGEGVPSTTISGSAVYGNSVNDYYGGAVNAEKSGPLHIVDSTVSDNAADDGGAVYAYETERLEVTESILEANGGSALYMYDADLSVSDSSFIANSGAGGGAVYLKGSAAGAEESISQTSFLVNHSVGYPANGGAIDDVLGDLKLEASTFASNSAEYGGALYYESGDGLSMTNDTFDSNVSGRSSGDGGEGGAIDLNTVAGTGSIALLNDTITRNTSPDGGGIYEPSHANSIENTIVAENVGGNCSGAAGSADKGGNIDSDGSCFGSGADDQTDVDPKLEPLDDNGGPTETDALPADSPAIGAGVSNPVACPATDQRGYTGDPSCDSGAFALGEADTAITLAAPSTKAIGEPLTYTLTVEDKGPTPATGVTVSDTLPTGTTFYSSRASQGSCSGTATVTCALGVLEASGTATVTIVVIPSTAGQLDDSGTVTANEEDPENENNSSSAETDVASNERVETIETTKTVEVTKTVNSTQTVYVSSGPSGVSGATSIVEAPCRSARSEAIVWKVPGTVQLRRIVVTLNGEAYRTLSGSARRVRVSMVGLPKGAVTVKITGYTASGERYEMTRTFHLCVPAKEGGTSSVYLTKQSSSAE